MAQTKGPELQPADIGKRVRMIRQRRGLSLTVVAGLAGISKGYLSLLETGQRRFDKRSLINALAQALGCSVIDLTGEPYEPADRRSADALAAMHGIELALHDCTLDDVPDEPARPVEELAGAVYAANAARDQARSDVAGREIGTILTELQIIAVTGDEQAQRRSLALLVEAAYVAQAIAKTVGHPDLAVEAARRGYDAARRLGDAALIGFATWYWVNALSRVGARRRVVKVLSDAIESLEPVADPSAEQPLAAEAYGMLHLSSGLHAAKFGNPDRAHDHVAEAHRIAERTGERNALHLHFGLTNTALWRLAIGVELEEGAAAHERFTNSAVDPTTLNSPGRLGALHVDLARALAQKEDGSQDLDAVRHLDQADRHSPIWVRHNPIARELLAELDNRARIRSWELKSLRHRFGLN